MNAFWSYMYFFKKNYVLQVAYYISRGTLWWTLHFSIPGAFDSVGRLLAQAETPVFQAEEAKKGLIGLARDLRGLAYAFNTKTSYMMLFDWMYPFS